MFGKRAVGQSAEIKEKLTAGRCAVIAAHPDDETLWAGGLILMHLGAAWRIVTLCRKSDADRNPKFFKALGRYGAAGAMGDLDDAPEQKPLQKSVVQNTILELLDGESFDIVLTHSKAGEYTRHLRHEETAKAVWDLWQRGLIKSEWFLCFAYEDGGGKHLPRAIEEADILINLPENIWQEKYDIITKIYGFEAGSFEARTTPRSEAFWSFRKPA